jgi:DNA-binding winged helix-turn-helix (wHTH) protein
MSSAMSALRFDIFEVDLGRRLLLREGSAVHLSPKALRLLEILIEQRPNALSKQELHDKVWPETFVSEATLASLIAELRCALEDDARSPRFIRTVFAYGYAFCGEVSTIIQETRLRGSLSGFVEWNSRQITLSEGENVIGRDPEAAVFIDDATVSRHHARLTMTAERVMLEDLGSKNGTFVLGKQIETVDLQDGSEFCVGGVTLVFRRSLRAASTITFDRSQAE